MAYKEDVRAGTTARPDTGGARLTVEEGRSLSI